MMTTTTGFNTQFYLLFSSLRHGNVRIASIDTTLELSKAEAGTLYAWLLELDHQSVLRSEPTFYPAIKNAIDEQGTALSETFGTVRVLHSDATQTHEFDFCSDRSLLLSSMRTNDAICFDQTGVLQLLSTLQQSNAGVQQ
jgi:hypothetical protein